MNISLRRIAAALLALWGVTALVAGRIGWALLVLAGAWLLWRRPAPTPPLAAAPPSPTSLPSPTSPPLRPAGRAVTPVEPVPYWLLPTAAAAGAAAVLHDREQPTAVDSEEPAEEDLCDESYDASGYAAPAARGWDGVDDADTDADADFGGSGGGGDWGDGMGDDFGGFGGGGDWGGADDW